jgi:LPS sulfotransferase NodH
LRHVGAHERQISHYFKGRMTFEGDGPVIDTPLILLAFTNRSGSNYLAELMRSTERLIGMGEGLNADLVAERSTAWGAESFPDYFVKLNKNRARPFGLKCSWDQLLMLLRANIPAMYPRMQVVHIRRRDILSQAISRHIAWQTERWTSNTKVEREVEPSYNTKSISGHVESIYTSEAMFPIIFGGFEIPSYEVVYEDLMAREEETVRDVMTWLGYPPKPDWTVGPTRLKRQADDKNKTFKEMYCDKIRATALGT